MPRNPFVFPARSLATSLTLSLCCLPPLLHAGNGYGDYRDDPSLSGPYRPSQPRYRDGDYSHSTFTDLGNQGTEWGGASAYRPLNALQRAPTQYRDESYGSPQQRTYRNPSPYADPGNLPGLNGLGGYSGSSLLANPFNYGLNTPRLYPDLLSTPLNSILSPTLSPALSPAFRPGMDSAPGAGMYERPSAQRGDPQRAIREAYEQGLRDAQRSSRSADIPQPTQRYRPNTTQAPQDYPGSEFRSPSSGQHTRDFHQGHANPVGRDYLARDPLPGDYLPGDYLPGQDSATPAAPRYQTRPPAVSPSQARSAAHSAAPSAGQKFRPWTAEERQELGGAYQPQPGRGTDKTPSQWQTPDRASNTDPYPARTPANQPQATPALQDTYGFRPLDLPAYDDRIRPPRVTKPNQLNSEQANRFEPTPIPDKRGWRHSDPSPSQGVNLPEDMERRLQDSVREFEMRLGHKGHQTPPPWPSTTDTDTEGKATPPSLSESLLGKSKQTGEPPMARPQPDYRPRSQPVSKPAEIEQAIRIAPAPKPAKQAAKQAAEQDEQRPLATPGALDSLLPEPLQDPQPWLDIQIMDVTPNAPALPPSLNAVHSEAAEQTPPPEAAQSKAADAAVMKAKEDSDTFSSQSTGKPSADSETSGSRVSTPATGFGNVHPKSIKTGTDQTGTDQTRPGQIRSDPYREVPESDSLSPTPTPGNRPAVTNNPEPTDPPGFEMDTLEAPATSDQQIVLPPRAESDKTD